MSATLLRFRFRAKTKFDQNTFKRFAYTVLLPEIPDDTPATNPLLQSDSAPKFSQVTTDNCINGVGKLVIDYEFNFNRYSEKIKEPSLTKTFSSVLEPIEKLSAPLDQAWSMVKILFLVKNSDEMTKAYQTLHRRVQKARVQKFHNLPLYHALRELNADKSHLSEAEQRVVDKYLLESHLNGIELSDHQQSHLNGVLRKIVTEKDRFREKLSRATDKFSHVITDVNTLKNCPESLLRLMARDISNPSRGPWEITLQPRVYNEFLKNCNVRELRWNVWNANVTRASGYAGDPELNNSIHIEELRSHRRDQAAILGFKSYVDMSMQTKMAGTVDNVTSMITTLHKWSKPAMEQEMAALQEFASSKGFEAALQPWDIPYWRQQQREELFNLDMQELRAYFPLPHVLKGLFKLCQDLFGLRFKDCTKEVDIWNDTVTVYQVQDESGKNLGSFYFDPYFRADKHPTSGVMECGSSFQGGTMHPISYLVMNIYPPTHGQPAYLTYEEVCTLFQKFGHCLQHVATTVKHSDVAGLTNIEWDAVNLCPQLMSNLLHDVNILTSITNHRTSGKPLSVGEAETLCHARQHMAGYDLTYQLYLSALDIQLYSCKDFWADVMRSVWSQYMPIPLTKKDSHPCAFSAIFCDEYPSAYYSFKWAEMLAADAYSAFTEASTDDEVQQVGRRFRQTFLSLGGACHPSEIFRRFRGRDPSPDALLVSSGLKE